MSDSGSQIRFLDNGDGTVTDNVLRLMWSKATPCARDVNHEEAAAICAELELAGHADWRLPTVEELFALADRTKYGPAIDTDAFPDTKSDWYWTSTATAWESFDACFVDFYDGYAYYGHRLNDYGVVRAVRPLPAST